MPRHHTSYAFLLRFILNTKWHLWSLSVYVCACNLLRKEFQTSCTSTKYVLPPACVYEYGVCLCVYRQESALPRQHGLVATGLRVRRQHDRGKENVSACVLCTCKLAGAMGPVSRSGGVWVGSLPLDRLELFSRMSIGLFAEGVDDASGLMSIARLVGRSTPSIPVTRWETTEFFIDSILSKYDNKHDHENKKRACLKSLLSERFSHDIFLRTE